MSRLTPIQELRYNLNPRLTVGSFPIPSYRYLGYFENKMLPRGADMRHLKLEERRQIQKHAEINRLILDRPFQ